MKSKKIIANKNYLPYFQYMLGSLKSHSLSVVIVNNLRQVEEQNCKWYIYFCGCYTKTLKGRRRKRTKIKRKNTVNVLTNIINKGVSYSKYYLDYLEIAKEIENQNWDFIDL